MDSVQLVEILDKVMKIEVPRTDKGTYEKDFHTSQMWEVHVLTVDLSGFSLSYFMSD